MMKRIVTMAAALLVVAGAYAQLKAGHFFKTFDSEYVAIEKAEQYFDWWFSLPEGTEWKLVGTTTDDLGMTRTEYCQYVGGIEVIGADGYREATPATMYSVDAPVYNMMGQQVDKSHKGLVIYKGRKYVNK